MSGKEVRAAIDASLASRRETYRQRLAFPVENPLSVERAELLYVYDSYGNQYLDLSTSALLNPLGHCRPAINSVILDHLNHYGHTTGYGNHLQRYQVEYAEALTESIRIDGDTPRVLFCESERDAVLTAVLSATDTSRSPGVMAFGDYQWLHLLREDTPWIPLQPQVGPSTEDWDKTGVLIIELVGPRGQVADKYWVQSLVDTAKRRGIPVIVDESRTGFGRTGTLWAHTQWSIDPDYVVLGGAVGGGMPLGAVIGSEKALSAPVPRSRFSGYPVACAAGLTVLTQVHAPLCEHVTDAGRVFENAFTELRSQFPQWLAGQQGMGLMRGIALKNLTGLAARFWTDAHRHGLLLDPPVGSFIPYTPPLIISEEEVRRSVDMVALVLLDWEPPT